MGVPKRKTSKQRTKSRISAHKARIAQTKPCSQCGAPTLSHRVCPSCGYYRGRQVVTIEAE